MDQAQTNTIQDNVNQTQPNESQPNTPNKKEGSQKGLLIGLAVIAVIALILAGFFYVSSKNTKEQADQQQQAVEQAAQELQEQVSQAEKEQAQKEAELARQQALLEAALQEAEQSIQDLNDQIEADNSTRVEQCETLLVTMPSEDVVTFRSANWEKDISKYYKDLEAEQKTYEQDSEEWDDIGTQKRVTEPYRNNFLTNCEDIYDDENSTITATIPASTPTQ